MNIDKMEELWKKIKGFENYSVSNLGRVRNDNTNRLLKLVPMPAGYLVVSLRNNGKQKTMLVSSLVMQAFSVTPPKKYLAVKHVNGILTDNRITNLIYSYNRSHTKDPDSIDDIALNCYDYIFNSIKSKFNEDKARRTALYCKSYIVSTLNKYTQDGVL